MDACAARLGLCPTLIDRQLAVYAAEGAEKLAEQADLVVNVVRAARLADRVHAQLRVARVHGAHRLRVSGWCTGRVRTLDSMGPIVLPHGQSLRTSNSCSGTPASCAMRRRRKVVAAVDAYRCLALVLITGPAFILGRRLSSCTPA